MLILDTSGLLAALNRDEVEHARAATALTSVPGPRLLSPFVLAELDYLLGQRVGRVAQDDLLAEVEREVYRLEAFRPEDISRCRAVIRRYGDLALELADASLVVLAGRYHVRDILTLDERHFRVVAGPEGLPFRVLPADLPL